MNDEHQHSSNFSIKQLTSYKKIIVVKLEDFLGLADELLTYDLAFFQGS
jgi:hypothetical protein